MRFTDTFIKMNSCVVGATVGRPFCVIKFAIVYENFGDHWSPVCVIEIHREPPLSRQCRQLPSRGALRNVAENKKPPIEGRWHEERVTEGWLLAKSNMATYKIANKCGGAVI